MTKILITLAICLGYIGITLRLFKVVRLRENLTNSKHQFATQCILMVVLLFHLWFLIDHITVDSDLNFSLSSAISAICWMALLSCWVFAFFYRLTVLYFLIIILTIICLPFILVASPYPITLINIDIFEIHPILSIAAYGIFTIAGLHTLIMVAAQKCLSRGKIPFYLESLPPLLTMEKILFRMIFIGLVFLSLALLTGMFFLNEETGNFLEFKHKIIFAISSWVIFVSLATGRIFFGWRGKTAVKWTLLGYSVLLLAYIGTRFVVEILLNN